MASLVTLATLRRRAQAAADQPVDSANTFITTQLWADFINYGAKRLYSILTSKFGDEYQIKSAPITLVNGTALYNLPADFYELRAVDLVLSGLTTSMGRFQFRDRNKYNWATINWSAGNGVAPLYSLVGNQIQFIPTPPISGNAVTLWYVPTLQKTTDSGATWVSGDLSADGDAIDDVQGFSQLIVLEAAILARTKENTDVSALTALRDEVLQWIETAARNRNAGEPMYVGASEPNDRYFFGS